MSPSLDLLEAFLSDEANFFCKIRFLEGLDKANLEVFLRILDAIENEVKNEMFIEKRLAYLLIPLVPILWANAAMYSGDVYTEIACAIGQVDEKISTIFEPSL